MAMRLLAFSIFVALVILQCFVQTTHCQSDGIPCKEHYGNSTTLPLECYHNGTCMVTVYAGFDPFPFCSCNSPYAGMQCEHLDVSSAGLQLPVIIGIVAGAIVLISILCIVIICQKKNTDRRRRQADRDIAGGEGGNDHGGPLFDPVPPGAGPA